MAAAFLWTATCVVLGGIQFVVTRSCAYELQPLAAYGAYFLLHVCLPGVVLVAALNRGPISLTSAIALGVPTGFALEIFSFLGLSALGLKAGVRLLPVVWGAGFVILYRWQGACPVRARLSARHAGVAFALSLLFLATAIAAASNLFAESPLVNGLPQRPIFHDWVYLVSRAALIKNLWPLEDPSLAGTALQYHYFMMVHVAAASWATGLEITVVLLRLMLVPLGAVLVVQVYALGRQLSRSPWGGVLAALLTIAAGEMAFSLEPNRTIFLGRFVRWLYVSPTFFFGVVFYGAVLLAVAKWQAQARRDFWSAAWLALLAATATAAKGTVMPVLLAALGLWAALVWARTRRFPTRLVIAGAVMSTAFAGVYQVTMSKWGTGAAAFVPFDLFRLSDFWQAEVGRWQLVLAAWMPVRLATWCATLACGIVVVAGTEGVRLLAIPMVFSKMRPREQALAGWLATVAVCSAGMGLLIKLDADAQLYVFLLLPLPAAVLAAASLVSAIRHPPAQTSPAKRSLRVAFRVIVAVALAVQFGSWLTRNLSGLADWRRARPGQAVDQNTLWLCDALLWVRHHTTPKAVLITNACTPENIKRDHWGALDRTLIGVHYYYSALAERRVWVEGPHYLFNPAEITRRVELAGDVFYRRRPLSAAMLDGMPGYALLDRSLGDNATIALPLSARVFANPRIEIYRVPPATAVASPTSAVVPSVR